MAQRNDYLQKFYALKLKIYNLLLKSVEENTDKYDAEVKSMNDELTALSKDAL